MASAAAARARGARPMDVGTLEVVHKRGNNTGVHHHTKHRPMQRSYAKPLCLFLAGLAILIPLVAVGNYSGSRMSQLNHARDAYATVYPTFDQQWHALPTPYSLDTTNLPVNNENATMTLGDLYTQLQGMQSGYNCSTPEPSRRETYIVCRYKYLAIWNGTVLFFHHDNTTTQPPALNIDWFLGAILGMEHPGTFEAYAAANLTHTTPVVVHEQAQLVFFTFGHNFYHVMSEYMPTIHTMLCRYLGLCTYNPHAKTQLIMVDPFNVHKELWYEPVNPAFTKCVTSMPVRHVQSPQFDGKLVVLKDVLAGWGSEARADHGHMHHWEDRHPPPKYMMNLWRERLAKCLGFDAHKQVSVDPINVVIIDRAYGAGRTFLNVEQMRELVERKYPTVNVQVKYLESMSVEEAAGVFDDATVVIWQHGAAMTNLVFMPEGASGIQIVMRDHPSELTGWPDELVRDLPQRVHLVHVLETDPDRVVLRPGYIRWSPLWGPGGINGKQKLAVWEHKQCPGKEYDPENHECEEFWIKIGASLEVDLTKLEQALEMVMPRYLKAQKGAKRDL